MVDDLKRKTVRGVFWNAAGSWGSQLVSFLVFLVLARLLVPKDFGAVAIAGAFLTLLQPLAGMGMGAAIVQRDDLQPTHLDAAFWGNTLLSGVMILVTFLVAPHLSTPFDEPVLSSLLPWMSIALGLMGLNVVPEALLQRDHDFRALALRRFAGVLCGAAVGVSMAYAGYGVWSLIGREIATHAVDTVALWRQCSWRPRLRFSPNRFMQLFRFGMPQMGTELLNFANRRSDDLIIGYFLGSTMLGYYTIAYRFLTLGTQLLTRIITPVSLATFARLQADDGRLQRAYLRLMHASAVIAFPAFAGLSLVMAELLPVAFGTHWTESIPVAQVLSLAGMLHAVLILNGSLMVAKGRPEWRFMFTLLNAVLNVTLFLIAVHYGIFWVAVAYVARTCLVSPISLLLIERLTRVPWTHVLHSLARPAVATVIMAMAIHGCRLVVDRSDAVSVSDGVLLLLLVAIGGLVYAACILGLDGGRIKHIRNDLALRRVGAVPKGGSND
jgi:O-antigen/teichoic acid export membrane protein